MLLAAPTKVTFGGPLGGVSLGHLLDSPGASWGLLGPRLVVVAGCVVAAVVVVLLLWLCGCFCCVVGAVIVVVVAGCVVAAVVVVLLLWLASVLGGCFFLSVRVLMDKKKAVT